MSLIDGDLQMQSAADDGELIQSMTIDTPTTIDQSPPQSRPVPVLTNIILGVEDRCETLLNIRRAMLCDGLFHCDLTLNQINNNIGLEDCTVEMTNSIIIR